MILNTKPSGGSSSFTAIYGITTYAEIVDAFNQGKTVYCYNSDRPTSLYQLTIRPTGNNNTLDFSDSVGTSPNLTYSRCIVNSNNQWSFQDVVDGQMSVEIYRDEDTELTSDIGYYRPIRVSTSAPTDDVGNVGDIWLQYEE